MCVPKYDLKFTKCNATVWNIIQATRLKPWRNYCWVHLGTDLSWFLTQCVEVLLLASQSLQSLASPVLYSLTMVHFVAVYDMKSDATEMGYLRSVQFVKALLTLMTQTTLSDCSNGRYHPLRHILCGLCAVCRTVKDTPNGSPSKFLVAILKRTRLFEVVILLHAAALHMWTEKDDDSNKIELAAGLLQRLDFLVAVYTREVRAKHHPKLRIVHDNVDDENITWAQEQVWSALNATSSIPNLLWTAAVHSMGRKYKKRRCRGIPPQLMAVQSTAQAVENPFTFHLQGQNDASFTCWDAWTNKSSYLFSTSVDAWAWIYVQNLVWSAITNEPELTFFVCALNVPGSSEHLKRFIVHDLERSEPQMCYRFVVAIPEARAGAPTDIKWPHEHPTSVNTHTVYSPAPADDSVVREMARTMFVGKQLPVTTLHMHRHIMQSVASMSETDQKCSSISIPWQVLTGDLLRSVVALVFPDSKSNMCHICTGFAASSTRVITCAHGLPNDIRWCRVWWHSTTESLLKSVCVATACRVSYYAIADIAVVDFDDPLKSDDGHSVKGMACYGDTPPARPRYFFSLHNGFMGQDPSFNTIYRSSDLSQCHLRLAVTNALSGAQHNLVEISAEMFAPGSSGAPVLSMNQDGTVGFVGIVRGTDDTQTVMVAADVVQKCLDVHNAVVERNNDAMRDRYKVLQSTIKAQSSLSDRNVRLLSHKYHNVMQMRIARIDVLRN